MRIMERAKTLFPHPLSPTTPSVSPRARSNETPSTARTTPSSRKNRVLSPSTLISGSPLA